MIRYTDMSKRGIHGDVCSSADRSGNLQPSPLELRELWDWDNECGHKVMGVPLRTCSCQEVVTEGDSPGIGINMMNELKKSIWKMWNEAKIVFEIFLDPKEQQKGYRLRAKNYPFRLTLKMEDAFFFGWCANVPTRPSNCSHLYDRSPLQPQGYMGGPASFCNWQSKTFATISLVRPTHSSLRHWVRLECKALGSGQELVWDYGLGNVKEMEFTDTWFKPCCNISNRDTKHQEIINMFPFMNVEKCVLCGREFPNKNKERRVQRKPHFITSHADFLGSNWNGLGPYEHQEVSATKVLTEADKLNSLLQTLFKDLKWHVLPACTVIESSEKDNFADDNALMDEFRKRCAFLKKNGTLVLRGTEAADSIENLSVTHLQPIPVSVWRNVNWIDQVQPTQGIYAAPSKSREYDLEVQSVISKFCWNAFK